MPSAMEGQGPVQGQRDGESDTRVYDITFSPNKGLLSNANQLGFRGPGTLEVTSTTLLFRDGGNGKFVRSSDLEMHQCAIAQASNKSVNGNFVRFSIASANGKPKEMGFWTKDDATAIEIAQILPGPLTNEADANRSYQGQWNKASRTSWITWTLVFANALIFSVAVGTGGGLVLPDVREMHEWGTVYGPDVLRGQYWRLFASMFLHFGIIHLGLNMLTLVSLGPIVERQLGSVRYAVTYLFCGLCGSMLALVIHPEIDSAGASGAIFGLCGALLGLSLRSDLGTPAAVVRGQRKYVWGFVVANLIGAARLARHIDFSAHIGGFLVGCIAGFLLAHKLPEVADDAARKGVLPGEIGVIAAILVAATIIVANRLAHL